MQIIGMQSFVYGITLKDLLGKVCDIATITILKLSVIEMLLGHDLHLIEDPLLDIVSTTVIIWSLGRAKDKML